VQQPPDGLERQRSQQEIPHGFAPPQRLPQRHAEIRGDGTTRTWTLPHSLDDPAPTVAVCDAAHRDVSGNVRCAWPSAHEVAITFALPPTVGTIYQVEFVAS
jgi:hypothetical protein